MASPQFHVAEQQVVWPPDPRFDQGLVNQKEGTDFQQVTHHAGLAGRPGKNGEGQLRADGQGDGCQQPAEHLGVELLPPAPQQGQGPQQDDAG